MAEENKPKEEKEEEFEFGELLVADCIAEKISTKEILSIGEHSINLSWTHIIALVNRKSKTGRRIDTQITVREIMDLYGKLMNKTFL